jgi:hypothetical protein
MEAYVYILKVIDSKWWPETGSESVRPFRICNLNIIKNEESGKSARMPACAFNLLSNFTVAQISLELRER